MSFFAVRDIFYRVENAFKKRKEETKVLEYEVGELEKNLDYLENQTQDQIKETASLNLAHANSKAGIASVDESIGEANRDELAACMELVEDLKYSTESGMDSCIA